MNKVEKLKWNTFYLDKHCSHDMNLNIKIFSLKKLEESTVP